MVQRIVYLILAIFLISFVGAVAPVLQTTQPGSLEIIAPSYEQIPINKSLDVYWHVLNTTQLLSNTSTTCNYHLYSRQLNGEHIITILDVQKFENDRDFEVTANATNFSVIGIYCHIIECNTSIQAGALERCFSVVENEIILSTSESIIYSSFFMILIFLFVITIFGIDKLPGQNDRDDEGNIIKISNLKYFRSVLWMFEWALIVAILFISSNLAFVFLNEELFANVLFILFRVAMGLSPVIVILWFIWIFVKIAQDKEAKKLLTRLSFGSKKW